MAEKFVSRLVSVSENGPILEIWERPGAGVILFYPGTMLAPGHYILLIRELWTAGLTVASPHFSGHGQAKKQAGFTFQTLHEEGLSSEKWLQNHNYGPIAVCGHSQGGILGLAHGAISTTMSALFPITGIFPQMPEAIQLTRFMKLANYREKLLAAFRAAARLFPSLPLPLPFYLRMSRVFANRRKPVVVGREKGRLFYPLSFLYSLFNAQIDIAQNAPVYFFSAMNDELFTRELTQLTFNRIVAPKKELIFLQSGGHLAPMNPFLAAYIARQIANICSSLGFPLHISANSHLEQYAHQVS